MTWLTTATVLQKLHDFGNREAWDSFTERFRRPVVSFARGMGLKQADAEDVAQETLLAFAEAFRRGQYDPNKTIASIVSFFPAEKPMFTVLIKIDQPKKNSLGGEPPQLAATDA